MNVYKNIYIPFWGWIVIAIFIIAMMAGPTLMEFGLEFGSPSPVNEYKFSQLLEWEGEKYQISGYLTGNENAVMESFPGGPSIPYQRLGDGVSLITLSIRKV